ncbi:MAG: NAD(+)/NADH kinase [Phycisphaerales bacterium]
MSDAAGNAGSRVLLVADWSRDEIAEVRDCVSATVEAHADEVVREDAEHPGNGRTAAPPTGRFDLAVVIGGDGTIIGQLRRMAATGIPVAGVNVGRLGFLAEFDAERFAAEFPAMLAGRADVQDTRLLQWTLRPADGSDPRTGIAVNDVSIASGAPFRMIELGLVIDEQPGPTLAGDGLIVASPTGSTAYSTSAGGPIVHPAVEAMLITPVAAQSLAFRPIVIAAGSVIRVDVLRANPGTALVRDGAVREHLAVGDAVEIRFDATAARLIVDPDKSYWQILQDKLQWAAPPRYRRP